MQTTKISWASHTWNPVTGCSKISDGCSFCYAETLSTRFGWTKKPWRESNAAETVRERPERLRQPLNRKTVPPGSRVFVNSLSDLFHAQVSDAHIDRVFAAMTLRPDVDFMVLTKRAERLPAYLAGDWDGDGERAGVTPREQIVADLRGEYAVDAPGEFWFGAPATPWPLPNVWLGVSVENQREADRRIPHLLAAPAAVRFLSVEPMLGPVDLRPYLSGLDLILCGGESGPHMGQAVNADRWMDHAWARDLRDQCVEAGVAFFFKQSSAIRTEMGTALIEPDGRRFEWRQMPGDLRPPVEVVA